MTVAAAEHQDNLFGDINMVNGVPWPVMTVQAKYHRFRVSSTLLACTPTSQHTFCAHISWADMLLVET